MDTNHFKHKLAAELKVVEGELHDVAVLTPEGEWAPKEVSMDTLPPQADANEAGDKIEEYEENKGIDAALEGRWNDIKAALEKIETGTYGRCEVCDKAIEEDRLEANPAARTCKEHM
jgi:DnaK suppressor protein